MQYRRITRNASCGDKISNVIVITVTNKLNAGQIGNNQTICYGAFPYQIQGTQPTGGIDIFSYKWERSTDGETWEELFGKTDKDLNPTQAITETTYYRREVISGTTTGLSNIVRIDHLPEVTTPEINYDSRYCKGDKITINSNLSKVFWYDETSMASKF